jgi:N-acetylglucosaminyl-diphospho-decaprenol L-rhamnosyltransferase
LSAVSIVVVAYNSGAMLSECVARALANAECGELVVIDNASDDGSIAALAVIRDPRLRILPMQRNAGFAVACNHGAASTSQPWLLFLNPDALLNADTLAQTQRLMMGEGRVGVLGVDVRDRDGRPEAAARRHDPTLTRMLYTQLGRWPGLARFAARGLELSPRDEILSDVDAVSGAFMLMPRQAFAQVGGFDEGYFLHAEDLDLCRRVRAAGWRVAIANRIAITHVQGTSSRSRPWFVVWHKHRSLWRYFVQHEGVRAWTPKGVILAGMLGLRMLGQGLQRVFVRPR